MKLRNVICLCILLFSSLPLFAGSPYYVPSAPVSDEQPLALPNASYYSPPPPYTGTNPSLDNIKQMLIAAGQKYQIPSQILFGIAFDESGWQQYTNTSNNHQTKYDLEPGGEVGVGIMQVTVYPSQSDYARLCTDIAYNIDQGTAILAEKWNITPIIGDNDRAKLENWYYAIWAYNGFVYGNVPQTNDPRYNSNPYQHKIIQYISQSPLNEWQSVNITEPTVDEIGEPPQRIGNTPMPVHIDANFDGIIDGSSQPQTPPSVSFNESNKNHWFGPNNINTQIVAWSLSNTGGGLGGFSQWWDNHDPGGSSPQYPNSTSGWLSFGSLPGAGQQGMHTVYVRTYNSSHSQSQVFSSGWYGYDAVPPTVTLTNDPGQGKVDPAGSWVAWNISDPDSGVSYWTQAWDNQTPQQYSTSSGYLYIPTTGTHTLHVHTWDNVGNNKDWTFGPYQVQNSTTTTVYVDSAAFTRQGPSQYWHIGSGYGLHSDMIWTYNNQSIVQNVGTWTPNLPVDGNYEVFVYIPRNYATTTSAYYNVYSANGTSQVRVNQFSYNDQWVSLGTYHFHAGTSGRLDLRDQTGEQNTTKQVGFDAAQWVSR